MSESFGMMDSAYFVGRQEILKWINDLLQVNVEKIEHLGNGAEFCQILDAIYNKDVPMSKVKFQAKHQHEILNNWRILQTTFQKHGIKKVVEVEKLMKCKYQDNLEFAQWMKKFFETNYGERTEQYDPIPRRKNVPNAPATSKKLTTNNNKVNTMPTKTIPNTQTKDTKAQSPSSKHKSTTPSRLPPVPRQQPPVKRKTDNNPEYEVFYKKVKTLVCEDTSFSHEEKIMKIQEFYEKPETLNKYSFNVPPIDNQADKENECEVLTEQMNEKIQQQPVEVQPEEIQ